VKSFRASGSAFGKQTQFGFWNGKLCKATIQTDHKLRKYKKDVGLVHVFQPTKMNGNLTRELAQILGTTGLTRHLLLRVLPTMVGNSGAEKRYTTPRKG
jgi:hypothetical protein